MKKINLVLAFFSLLLFTSLFSSFKDNPDDPPNGYTGSSGSTCGSCHSGGSFGGVVFITGIPSTITPNTTYTIQVTTSKTAGSTKRAGFQLNVLNGSGSNVGTLSTTSIDVNIQGNFAEHFENSGAQNFVSSSGNLAKSWFFKWTSPTTTNNNNLTFYVSSVIGNGANGTSGDQVVNSSFTSTFTPPATPLTVTQVTKTNVSCRGGANGTATVTASGGTGCSYTYAWSNGQTGAVATGLAAGTYTVTATCGASTGSTSINITEPATVLTANATGSALNCVGGNNGTASVTASGGGSTYSYFWSNGSTSATQSNLSAGTYNVTITDNNGCTLVRSATVSNPTNSVTASTSTTSATCVSTGTATVSPSNGTSPYTYFWSNGQTNPTATNLTSGNYSVTVTDNNGCTTTSTAIVGSNTTPPSSAISGNSTLTCSQNTITLSAPSGASSYAWSNGENNITTSVNMPGTYSVTVTNPTNGCTASSSKTITEDKTVPNATINGNTILTCAQPQLTLSSSGNNSFLWSGPGIISSTNSSSINLNNTGTYSLTVTSLNNGCTNSNSVNITENKVTPSTPNINPSTPTITCANSFVTLSSSLSGAFTQQWNYNNNLVGTGTQINATQPGNYVLVITDPSNGCTSSNFTTVNSTKTTLSVNTTGGKITCSNPSVTLTANAAGAVGYNWTSSTFNSTQQNPSVTTQGTYTVIATDINGCTGSAQATVTSDTQKPSVTASVNGSISCSNPNVTLTASSSTSGLSYSWSSSNGFSATGNPTTTQQSGTFTVTATNPTNGCSNSAIVTVTASNDKPILTTKGGTITCKDTIVAISVSVTGNTSGLTYKWQGVNGFSSNQSSANVKNAGDYLITVTAGNGCSSTAIAKVLIDNQAITPELASSKEFICLKDTLNLSIKNSTNFNEFIWSDKSTTNAIDISKSGSYTITATGTNGCKGQSSITIKDGLTPTLLATADSLTCAISKLILNASINWSTPTAANWSGPNGFSSTVLQPEINTPGEYILSVNPTDGCPNSVAVTVKENKTPPSIQITSKSGFNSCDSLPITIKVLSSAKSNTYSWIGENITSTTNDSVTIRQSGKYAVKVTDEKGCTSVDSTQVTLYPKITILLDVTACDVTKGIATIKVNGGKSPFEIKDGKGATISASNFQSSATLFPITIKDANGCLSTINKFDNIYSSPITVDKTSTKINDATEGKSNGSIILSVTSLYPEFSKELSYSWSNGTTGKDLLNIPSGKYCVTVTNKLGCSLAECFDVKNLIATEDKFLSQSIQIYPNPTSNVIFINFENNIEIKTTYLMNEKGQVIYASDNKISSIDLSQYPAGIYFVKFTDKKGKFSIKKILKL